MPRCASTSSWSPGTTTRVSWSIASSATRRRSASTTARSAAANPWATAIAAVEAPVPPGPVTATRHPSRPVGGSRTVSPVRSSTSRTGVATLVNASTSRVRSRSEGRTAAAPSWSQSRGGSSATTSGAALTSRARASRSRSTPGLSPPTSTALNGRPLASRERSSAPDTQRTNSTGMDASVAQRPTRRNQSVLARASPATTNLSPISRPPAYPSTRCCAWHRASAPLRRHRAALRPGRCPPRAAAAVRWPGPEPRRSSSLGHR